MVVQWWVVFSPVKNKKIEEGNVKWQAKHCNCQLSGEIEHALKREYSEDKKHNCLSFCYRLY